jgi:hypothetical protein
MSVFRLGRLRRPSDLPGSYRVIWKQLGTIGISITPVPDL